MVALPAPPLPALAMLLDELLAPTPAVVEVAPTTVVATSSGASSTRTSAHAELPSVVTSASARWIEVRKVESLQDDAGPPPPFDSLSRYAPHVAHGLETVGVFPTATDLMLAQSELVAAGIETFVPDELTLTTQAYLAPGLGGFRLMAHADDVEVAKEILRAIEERAAAAPIDDEDDDVERCAACASTYIGRETTLIGAIARRLFLLPARWFPDAAWCRSCGAKFVEVERAAEAHPYRARGRRGSVEGGG